MQFPPSITVNYLLFGLAALLGTAGVFFIFIKFMADSRYMEWEEDDDGPRHRWGVILLIASAVCWTLFFFRL